MNRRIRYKNSTHLLFRKANALFWMLSFLIMLDVDSWMKKCNDHLDIYIYIYSIIRTFIRYTKHLSEKLLRVLVRKIRYKNFIRLLFRYNMNTYRRFKHIKIKCFTFPSHQSSGIYSSVQLSESNDCSSRITELDYFGNTMALQINWSCCLLVEIMWWFMW